MDETQALSDDDEHEAAKLLLDDQNEVQCRLVLVSDEPNVPKELLLSSGENHIGRAEKGWDQGAPYHRIDHDKVSRRHAIIEPCLIYTSPSPRDKRQSRMPSSA